MTLLNTPGEFGISDFRVTGSWYHEESDAQRERREKEAPRSTLTPRFRDAGGSFSIVVTAFSVQNAIETVLKEMRCDISVTKVEKVG